MAEFLLKEIVSTNIEKELELIGFDNGYKFKASDKFRYKNIKIYNLKTPQANIIKQTALSVGADCATNKNVICSDIDTSDAILGGSISQLKKIAEKLEAQPFNLKNLGQEILNFLNKTEKKTKLAGILNVTPDSFSDGGLYMEPLSAQRHLIEMIKDGADMIDIGAESTKPFSNPVSADEQIARLRPLLKFVQQENIKIPISIDTRSSIVADFALNNGAVIINDVSGFDYDKNMVNIISKYNSGVIVQHSKGCPENMQINPRYTNITDEIFMSLKTKIEIAKNAGIKNIIAYPGIGFGKTREHNFEILDRIEEFFGLGCPIMAGVSRKSLLNVENDDNDLKDSLSAAISYPLAKKGIDYLRVHNIKLHKYMLKQI